MFTPLRLRRHLKFPTKFRGFSTGKQEIVSIEEKRKNSENSTMTTTPTTTTTTEAPSFLPSSNFPYDYKPMTIFEEQIGKSNS